MKNLLHKKARIDSFLTSDPYNKRGETGTIINVSIIDEDEYSVHVKFNDGVIGIYQSKTFEIL